MLTEISAAPIEETAASAALLPPPASLDVTDEHLMAMIQNRQPDAIGMLHDRYARLIKALVMKVIHNDAESDDLTQEIFMEIWERAAGYDPAKGKALSWVVTLARRRAIDRLRKREAYSRMEDRLLIESQAFPQDAIEHVEQDAEYSEMREHIQRAMALLPVAQQEVVHMAYFKGMSQRDISKATGIPLGTIKTRLELAMKKLACALQGFEDLL